MPAMRPGKALQKDRPEHDAELVEVDVVFARAAVEQDRAEDHLDQQRVVDDFAEHFAGGAGCPGLAELVVIVQRGHQSPEIVDLAGKPQPHLRFEQIELVGELQHGVGKDDGRAELRGQGPLVPGDAQLPQQPGQRAAPRAFGV